MNLSAKNQKRLAQKILRFESIHMNFFKKRMELCFFGLTFIFLMFLYTLPLLAEDIVPGYEFKSRDVAVKKDVSVFYSSLRDAVIEGGYEFNSDQSLFDACGTVCDKGLFVSSSPVLSDTENGDLLFDILLENGVTDLLYTGAWIDSDDTKSIIPLIESLRSRNNNKGKLYIGLGKKSSLSRFFVILVNRAVQFEQCRKNADRHIVNQIIFKTLSDDIALEITAVRPDYICERPEAELIAKNQYIVNYRVPDIKGIYLFSIAVNNGKEHIETNLFPVYVEYSDLTWRKRIAFEFEKRKIAFKELDKKYLSQSNQDKTIMDFLNDLRKSFGLEMFKSNDQVRDFAEVHCRDMAENSFFSHYSEIRGSFLRRLKELSFQFSKSSEIIQKGITREKLFKKIFLSPLSLYRLLDPHMDHAGISVQRAQDSSFFLCAGLFRKHEYLSSTGSSGTILKMINTSRKSAGLKPLTEDYGLSKAALKHCKYMAETGYPVISRKKGQGSISEDIESIRKGFGKLKLQVWYCSEPDLPEKEFYNRSIYDTFGLGIVHGKSDTLGSVYFCVLILGERKNSEVREKRKR
jgi:uncharacterized protein YkwD